MTDNDQDKLPDSPSAVPADPHLWEIRWVRDLFCLGVVVAVVLLAWWLRAIVEPLLVAVLFAYLLNPIVVWCERTLKWSRLVSVIALFSLTAAVVVTLGVVVVPFAVAQANDLISKLPDYADALAKKAGVNDEVVLQEIRERGASLVKDPINTISYLWNGVATSVGVLTGVIGMATSIIMGLALFPVYLFCFAWKWPKIAAWPVAIIPTSRRERWREVAKKMDQAVGGYFRTRLIIALIMGVMYAIGWGIAGVPYWLLVGMLAGLLGIIPYAASFAWIVAMVLQFLELDAGVTGLDDALAVFVWPSLVYGIVQVSDDWLLTPWLQGSGLDMNLVSIILAVLIGGAVAGLLGMLLAVPTAACLRIYWAEVVAPRLERFAQSH